MDAKRTLKQHVSQLRPLVVAAVLGLAVVATWAAATDEDAAANIAQAALTHAPTVGGPRSAGVAQEPTPLGLLKPSHQMVDVQLQGVLAPFSLTRSFSATPDTWMFQRPNWKVEEGSDTPAHPPFGLSPQDPKSLQWTHSLYSYVSLKFERSSLPCNQGSGDWTCDGEMSWKVMDPTGRTTSFEPCSNVVDPSGVAPCFAIGGDPLDPSARLYWNGTGFVFYNASGRYYFTQRFSAYLYFLERVEDAQYAAAGGSPRETVRLSYAVPPGCVGVAGIPGNGVPFIYEATVEGGERLQFEWQKLARTTGLNECVLKRVKRTEGSTTQTLAEYAYRQVASTERPGLLAAVTFPAESDAGVPRTVRYTYSSTSCTAEPCVHDVWRVEDNGLPIVTKQLSVDGGIVVSETSPDESFSVAADGPCAPGKFSGAVPDGGGVACPTTQWQHFTHAEAGRTSGEGVGASVFLKQSYEVSDGIPGGGTKAQKVECVAGACGSFVAPLPQSWTWMGVDTHTGGSLHALAHQDSQRSWTVYDTRVVDGGAGPVAELRGVKAGALTDAGVAPLLTAGFTYSYGESPASGGPRVYEQRLETRTVPSMLGASNAVERRRYEVGTNRLTAVIREGLTQTLGASGGVTVEPRTVGVFYSTQRTCGATSVADPYGRTLEVRGPCLVSNASATDCNTGPSVPVTQYTYYPGGTGGPGRLATETKYPSLAACAAQNGLTTTYEAYDWRGRPTQVKDASGVRTTSIYAGDLLVETRVETGALNPPTTRYTYDSVTRNVRSVQYPDGHYEVSCYRVGADERCSANTGTDTDKLMWKAKSHLPDGSAYSEKVAYTYRNGFVETETFFGADGEKRRVKRYEPDPLGRPTHEAWGDAAGAFVSAKGFGGLGATAPGVDALGMAYNVPPPLCRAGGGYSPACAQLNHDLLGRLTALVEFPEGSYPGTQTRIAYDTKQGQAASVATGCTAGWDVECAEALTTHYTYDDFGNVIAVKAPWTRASAPSSEAGTTYLAYDAAGNVVKKQTPQMASAGQYLEYAYDGLNRLLNLKLSTQAELLTEYVYDGPPTGDASRTCTLVSPTYAQGRIYLRRDSFGFSWFEYNALGNVTRVLRLRAGAAGACSATRSETTPNSSYTYMADGRLSTETYPHGRTVQYGYYASGEAHTQDRVKSLSVTPVLSTGDGAPVTLLKEARWEPYGGLRSYVAVSPSAAAGATDSRVEYLLGTGAHTAPTDDCGWARPADTDGTGRLRGLWVSRLTGAQTDGGSIFKRLYTWKADQLERQDTCLLTDASADKPRSERYFSKAGARGYDQKLQLKEASRGDGEFAARGGAFGKRSYLYDARGNRTQETRDAWRLSYVYDAVSPDRLLSVSPSQCECSRPDFPASGCPAFCQTTTHSMGFAYDLDGRVLEKTWFSAGPTDPYALRFEVPSRNAEVPMSAAPPVYKSVNAGGQVYEYFYDANGRRRLKVYPTQGETDEFFYDGDKLLEDYAARPGATAEAQLDEYLWLDGRPVALLKSSFSRVGTVLKRNPDLAGDCPRNGQSAPCGFYAMVTDYLGKPVLMLDASRRVAGAVDYEPFGHVNRATYFAQRSRTELARNGLMASLNQPRATVKEVVQVRARFALADTGATAEASSSFAFLSTDMGAELASVQGIGFTTRVFGVRRGPVLSDWADVPANGRVQVRYALASTSNPSALQGLVLEGYEYRRFEAGAAPVWTPLRFPGQYHDAETDLFENWNRYYDPSIGRYLGPEPMYASPKWVLKQVAAGMSPAVYAYASSNPLRNVDPTGLYVAFFNASGTQITASSSSEELLAMMKAQETINTLANSGVDSAVASLATELRDSSLYGVNVYLNDNLSGVNGVTVTGKGWYDRDPSGAQGVSSILMNPVNSITASGTGDQIGKNAYGGALYRSVPSNFEASFAHEFGHAAYNMMQWGKGSRSEADSNGWAVRFRDAYAQDPKAAAPPVPYRSLGVQGSHPP